MSVINSAGEEIPLFELWAGRKVVVAFTRHMGCRFCKEQVAALRVVQPKLLLQDIAAVVITVGKMEDIPRFKEENNFRGEVYVDANLHHPECYRLMRLSNGEQYLFANTEKKQFLASTVTAAERAQGAGYIDGGYPSDDSPYTGDVFQIGGIFVLGPGNSCDYSFRCSFAGDAPNLNEVLAAATGVATTGEEVFYEQTLDWNRKLNTEEQATTFKNSIEDDDSAASESHITTNHLLDVLVFVGVVAGIAGVLHVAYDVKLNSLQGTTTIAALLVGIGSIFRESAMKWWSTWWGKGAIKTRRRNSSSRSSGSSSISDDHRSQEVKSSNCPFASQVIGLHQLTEIDKAVMASGDVKCDCSFLEEVDMTTTKSRKPRAGSISNPLKMDAFLTNMSSASISMDAHDDDGVDEVHGIMLKRNGDGGATGSSSAKQQHTSSQQSNTIRAQQQQAQDCDLPATTLPRLSSESLLAAQSIVCYVREFLAKPNPNLGRKGPTCPFVPTSLKMNSLHLAVVNQAEIEQTSGGLESILMHAIEKFKSMLPNTGPKASFKAIIMIFPDMEQRDIPEMIDGTQKKLKPHFVAEGLMLGEFHLRNNATGLHNDHFYPLRTPYPCLAIRHMVPSDIAFLNPDEFSQDQRISMIEKYLEKFGGHARNDKQTEAARVLLKELKSSNSTSTD